MFLEIVWERKHLTRSVRYRFPEMLVLGSALFMEALGLSMALGTFIADVLLAESEYRHEVEIAIDPVKGLLLGLLDVYKRQGLHSAKRSSRRDQLRSEADFRASRRGSASVHAY